MLYLEDFLEMIEHLPTELQDRFSDIREVDRSIEGRMENLESRQKSFFASCRKTRIADREEEFQKIREEYKKLIDESHEKCNISEDCYNLVDRYLRKLDQELHDFKMELEADNRGITELLERHSLELDQPSESNHKENRVPKKAIRKHHNSQNHTSGVYSSENGGFLINDALSVDSLSPSSPSSNAFGHIVSTPGFAAPSHFGANPIAAAATQAIAATQQLTGRRTSSLKATYEAIHLGVEAQEFSLGLGDGASDGSVPATPSHQAPRKKKRKNPSSATSNLSHGLDSGANDLGVNDDLGSGRDGPPDGEWFDPSEPRYCLCNQVSYGEMVGCDNPTCPAEWFHYACVGVSQPPKGKWFCPTCSGTMTKKKGRKQ